MLTEMKPGAVLTVPQGYKISTGTSAVTKRIENLSVRELADMLDSLHRTGRPGARESEYRVELSDKLARQIAARLSVLARE